MNSENPLRQDQADIPHRSRWRPGLWVALGFTSAVVMIAAFQAWGSRAESQPTCPPGITSFEARTPARATDINCNFANLDNRLEAVESSVMFFTSSSCPAGYVPYELGQGRYVVGAPASAPVGGTVGNALSDRENRPVGQHTHVATQPAHNHNWNDPGHTHQIRSSDNDANGGNNDYGSADFRRNNTERAFTGIRFDPQAPVITVEDAGSVAGTPAPYVQLRVCVRAP
jgi:hypothetical protein